MSDPEIKKIEIELQLEDEGLDDVQQKNRLIGCIPSKYKIQKKKKNKIKKNMCNMCKDDNWVNINKEHARICKNCGHKEQIKEQYKKEWLPDMGIIPTYVPQANQTMEGFRLDKEQSNRVKLQKKINKQLNPKQQRNSELQKVKNDVGDKLTQIYKGYIPNQLLIDILNIHIEMKQIYKLNNKLLPRGNVRKSINVLLIWYLSDGDLQNILNVYTEVNKNMLLEADRMIKWMINGSSSNSYLRNMKIKLLNDKDVTCYEDLRELLTNLRKKIKSRFNKLTDSEIHVISVGLYLIKTPEGKKISKGNNIDKINKECNIKDIKKQYNEVFKWFKSESIWSQIN
tara:strand:+ start:206 stop:1228 length:1023 start_codon:yes stop_codon:yes gene_type:complete